MPSPLTKPLQKVSRDVVQKFGQPVTFTRTVSGAHEPETETFGAPTETTISGYALRARGDKDTYIRLGLVYAKHPTLVFAPSEDDEGELPESGDTVVWAGKTYTVKEVGPVAPDGTAIMARVVCE